MLRKTPLLLAIVALALAVAPAAARADETVVILGITSMEGDDDVARNLTGALRHAASQVHGWRVSDAEVTLAQMSLAHGCSDEPERECLAQIGSALQTQRIIYGILRREGSGYTLALSSYNVAGNELERTISEAIPARRTDIDDLREPARRMIGQLSGPLTGTLRIASNVPNATVRVDGANAGSTDGSGEFSSSVPVGSHQVEVSAPGYEPWTGSVTMRRDTEMTLDAQLTETSVGGGDGGGGGGGGPSISWAGIGLLGLGVAAFAVSIYSWVAIQGIRDSAEYRSYADAYLDYYMPRGPNPIPGGDTDVCREAARGMAFPGSTTAADRVQSQCGEADTLEVLQYVFLGVAVAAGATGAIFLITGVGADSGEREQAFQLTPTFGPGHAGMSARLRF